MLLTLRKNASSLSPRFKRNVLRLTVCLACIMIVPGCVSRLFYYPTTTIRHTPADRGLAYRDLFFNSADGASLTGWWVESTSPTPKGVLLHLHGNAQNMGDHFEFVRWLPAEGFHVVTMDYRGYGNSQGSPTRKGVYHDTLAALRLTSRLASEAGLPWGVIGQSLGGANAVAVLGREPVNGLRALIVDSAFFGYREIVRDKIGLIPVLRLLRTPLSWLIISNRWSPGSAAPTLPSIPILYLHGTHDLVIPHGHSEHLAASSPPSAEIWLIPGGQHTDAFFDATFRQRTLDWLNQHFQIKP